MCNVSEEMNKKFNELLEIYNEDIFSFPELERQYSEELTFFTEKVIEQNKSADKAFTEIFAAALVELGVRRAEENAKSKSCPHGVCTSGVKERAEKKLSMIFSEDELSMLFQLLIQKQEPTGHYKDMLCVMLHNAPHVPVYPCGVLIKTDEEEINS